MTDRQEMEAVVEAILFVSNDVVPRIKLLEVFDEGERDAAAEALEAVIERYREDAERGFMIDEAGGGLRLVSRPDLHSYLRRFFELTGSNKLSMPGLESLAIIAYRQPVTAPEIQELRGVSSSGVLKKLLERRLIRISGRKEVVGKPFLYATTREFLQHFGLRNLKELPPLEQFEELFGGDSEAASNSIGPDPEEQADLEAAEIEARDDEAFDKAEAEAIEEERAVAEEVEDLDSNVEELDPGQAHVEGPAVEEPAVEEPAVEEPAVEEPAVEEAAVEEVVAEEPAVEEVDAEGPDVEAAEPEEPAADESQEAVPAVPPSDGSATAGMASETSTEVEPSDSSAEDTPAEQPSEVEV